MRASFIRGFAVLLLAGCSCEVEEQPPDAGPTQGDAAVLDGGPRPSGCGDGRRDRDEGEVCDDGNTDDGDGCSADCRSDESCGNGFLDTAVGEQCDDGNTDDGDGCRGDCGSDYTCGNGVTDTIATGASVDEVCDDGNTLNGDGCSAACDSDESCGNAIVDLGAGEVCDDGNTDDGDECSADCRTSTLCGNGELDGAEECDDGNNDPADGCNADCQIERCGNGRLDPGETCDDGNTDDTDGCTADCGFTCSADADCADSDVCNGAETCRDAGTAMSACDPPASAAPDGTACGAGLICLGAGCVTSACGDGFADPARGEDCDDGNTTDGDGCDNDCTFTCSADADCADADVCDGLETCSAPGTSASACAEGSAPPAGTSCGSGLLCSGGACVAARCGDTFVTGTEQCDDGNTTDGDGCENDCTWTCTAAADCSDGNLCNGTETCTMPSTLGSRCVAGSPPTDGTSCGGGRICRMGTCATAGCGDGIVSSPEQCDDGNMTSGDGCDNDCTWTCTAAADCSDGNACNGAETCTSPGTLGSRCNAGAPPAPGTSCGTGLICVGTSCIAARCGDSIVTGTEQCDDGNTTNGDGCDNDCTFTCSGPADCSDGLACNGAETCSMPGTTASRCNMGAAPPAGTSCGTGQICVGGSCVAARCGDMIVTGAEQCDDGNTVNGDGCDNDCGWTCTGAADCADGNVCNGSETCTSPSTLASRCTAGTAPPTGTSCDRDANPATRDICIMSSGTCALSVCGDSFIDVGRSPPEQCDDGNTSSGDGCSATCQTETAMPPTGFRLTSLRLISPRITASIPFGGCQDITQNCASVPLLGCQADSVNTLLANAINPTTTTNGEYSLHIVELFRPLNPAAATTPTDLHLNAACMQAPTPDSCEPDAMPDVTMSNANNQAMGNCFVPLASDVNTRAGPAAYTPTANTVGGPCFISDPESLTVSLGGIDIPLTDARVAATYSGTPVNQLVSGVVVGFLSETAAADVLLPADLPVVGNTPLYTHLQAGNVSTTNSMGATIADGCNVGGGTHEDDADMNGGVRGFWFFLNFTAEHVTWTGP